MKEVIFSHWAPKPTKVVNQWAWDPPTVNYSHRLFLLFVVLAQGDLVDQSFSKCINNMNVLLEKEQNCSFHPHYSVFWGFGKDFSH